MKQEFLTPVSRRQFVKTLSAGAAVSAMPGILQSQQAPSQKVIGANNRSNVDCVGRSDRFTDELLPAVGSSAGNKSRLPSFQKGSSLLFQGDSITDMKWGRDQSDRNHYLGHSYVFLLAARLGVDMPEAELDIYNRGISGHTVADLRKRWQKDAIDIKPDLLSILIGTNDVGQGVREEAYEADYRGILDASRALNPALRIVLLDPFVLRSGALKEEKAWSVRRQATDKLGVVVARLTKDYGAVHIKTQAIFDAAAEAVSPEHWMWDGIHPLPQGHELIARHWLQEVSARWPQA